MSLSLRIPIDGSSPGSGRKFGNYPTKKWPEYCFCAFAFCFENRPGEFGSPFGNPLVDLAYVIKFRLKEELIGDL